MIQFEDKWANGLDGGGEYTAENVHDLLSLRDVLDGQDIIEVAIAESCRHAVSAAEVVSDLDFTISQLLIVRNNIQLRAVN